MTLQTCCGLLCITVLAPSACTGGPDYYDTYKCFENPCNRVEIQGRTATPSDASVNWRGSSMTVAPLDGSETPPEGSCSLNLRALNADDQYGTTVAFTSAPRTVDAKCTLEGRELTFSVYLDDLRIRTVGSRVLQVTGSSTCPTDEPLRCNFVTEATLVVSTATGGKASFPEMATSDFSRSLELTLDVDDKCADKLKASFRFAVVAADYKGIANTTCKTCKY